MSSEQWGHEQALVRGNTSIQWNLAIGEPTIIRKELKSMGVDVPDLQTLDYPSMDLVPELESAIRAYFGNKVGKRIIVPAIGAKQALHAALYAMTRGPLKKKVTAPVPYWVSYPTIARYADCDWVNHHAYNYWNPELIEIIASPNNPDGWIWNDPVGVDPRRETLRIWDAAYASPLYGFPKEEFPPYNDISVWSGGKLTGLPGLRVGWLATHNQEFADAAKQYIEQTTSGVSQVGQRLTAQAIRYIYGHSDGLVDRVRRQMQENQDIILGTIGKFLQIKPDKLAPGMFLWVNVPDFMNMSRLDRALEASKIAVLRGSACGKTETGWYRWSLGQPAEYTRAAMEELEKNL